MEASERRRAIKFKLVLGGKETIGVFRQGRAGTEVIDFKEIDQQGRRSGPATIVLKRGVDQNKSLWEWRNRAIEGGPDEARTNAEITLLDYDGSTIATYSLKQAWPSKYTGASRDRPAEAGEVELVEIAHEGLKRA
jgi:phage tail-like protein